MVKLDFFYRFGQVAQTNQAAKMDAIKKKMQAMKMEKDAAMDKADTCEGQAKDANARADKVSRYISMFKLFIITISGGSFHISPQQFYLQFNLHHSLFPTFQYIFFRHLNSLFLMSYLKKKTFCKKKIMEFHTVLYLKSPFLNNYNILMLNKNIQRLLVKIVHF